MNRVRVGLASLALALAACQGNQAVPSSSVPATVSPGTARATTAPEPSPVAASPAPTVAVSSFKPDSLVRVVTNDLRMRTEPGVHDGSIKLQPLLRAGTFAVVLDGPVAASGYDWFRIHPLDPRGALPEVGWVAAVGKDGERWIAAHSPDCPPPPVSLFEERLGEHPLACYGSREFTFSARLGGEETGPCFELALAWSTVADGLDFDTCARMLFLVDPATPLDDRAWEAPSYHPVFAVELEPNSASSRDLLARELAARQSHGPVRPLARPDLPERRKRRPRLSGPEARPGRGRPGLPCVVRRHGTRVDARVMPVWEARPLPEGVVLLRTPFCGHDE